MSVQASLAFSALQILLAKFGVCPYSKLLCSDKTFISPSEVSPLRLSGVKNLSPSGSWQLCLDTPTPSTTCNHPSGNLVPSQCALHTGAAAAVQRLEVCGSAHALSFCPQRLVNIGILRKGGEWDSATAGGRVPGGHENSICEKAF